MGIQGLISFFFQLPYQATISSALRIIDNQKKIIIKILKDKVTTNIGKEIPIDSRLKDDWKIIISNKWKRNKLHSI